MLWSEPGGARKDFRSVVPKGRELLNQRAILENLVSIIKEGRYGCIFLYMEADILEKEEN